MTEDTPPPAFDSAKMLDDARKGDDAARAQAYRRLFRTEVGRFVLLDLLRTAGVGTRQGLMDTTQRNYAAGRADLAIDIAHAAGFDGASVALSTLTETLEGQQNDGHISTGGDVELDSDDEFG